MSGAEKSKMTNLIQKIRMLTKVKQTHIKIIEGSKITMRDKIFINVFRRNTVKGDTDHHYDKFEIPVRRSTTVLDALLYAKSYLDTSIGIRYSCRMASCGSCGMKINGIPRLACFTKVSELEGDTITCAPLSNFPHIRDLVTDFSYFFDHHRNMKPYIHNEYATIKLEGAEIMDKDTCNANTKLVTGFKQTPEEVDKYLQFSYCIKCGLCYSACPTAGADLKFPGPQALAQMYRYVADSRDNAIKERLDIVDNQHGVWRCHFPSSCSVVCPKGVDPSLGIQLLKSYLLGISKNKKRAELFRDV
jgi:succinate dehydrogenase / fumarate reductase, iron-sulfur subunit